VGAGVVDWIIDIFLPWISIISSHSDTVYLFMCHTFFSQRTEDYPI